MDIYATQKTFFLKISRERQMEMHKEGNQIKLTWIFPAFDLLFL